tara:strand:+ start:116 stop:382 length:267 start_codon:yes stop_codon:yes gene_type:complete
MTIVTKVINETTPRIYAGTILYEEYLINPVTMSGTRPPKTAKPILYAKPILEYFTSELNFSHNIAGMLPHARAHTTEIIKRANKYNDI